MSEHSHHIIPVRYYVGVFIALLFLTIITVTASQIHLSPATGIILALLIALIKTSLVLFIFMGLKWDNGFNVLIALSTFIFIGIFLFFTLTDEMSRGGGDDREAGHFGLVSPVKPLTHDGKGAHHE